MESDLLGYALFLLSYLVSTIAFYRFSIKEIFADISKSKGRLDFLPIVWGLVQFFVFLGFFYIFSLNYLWNAMPVFFFPLVLNALFLVLVNSISDILSGRYEKVRSGVNGYLIRHAPMLIIRDFIFVFIVMTLLQLAPLYSIFITSTTVDGQTIHILNNSNIDILYLIFGLAWALFLVKPEQGKSAHLRPT